MSLILDALRQAETERGTGSAPDLFAPVPPTAHTAPEATPPRLRWAWPAIALLLAAALLWALWRPQVPGGRSASRTAPPSSVPTAPPTPEAVTRSDLPQAITGAATGSAGGALFRPAPSPPVPPAASTARIAPNAATGVPPIAPQPATPLDDIGAAQRAGLPPLQITGHTYSDNPTLRMLMIDGHMVVEGQALAPGLRLERIGPHQAIFNHRGTRFSVGY